uniref:Uncharacterized protein n=1 Tax=Oncorhynchus mykiss TaxID=8022 RepID=A0A8C7UEG4_ONCMY
MAAILTINNIILVFIYSFQDGLDVSFRGSRGASFAQILNKIICAPSDGGIHFSGSPEADVWSCCCSTTGGGIRPKSIPQELIDWYKRGETHAVSALYLLSQVLQFQVELKEMVTTGKFSFYRLRDQFTGLEISLQA